MNVKIQEITPSDFKSFKDVFNSEFDDFWNLQTLQQEIEASNTYYIVAKYNNQVIGFAGIKITLDSADIMNIVVKKDFRKKGVGTFLVENLIKKCDNLNISKLFLEVNEENIYAINLYSKLGFKQISIRKNYYKDKSAKIMLKKLSK